MTTIFALIVCAISIILSFWLVLRYVTLRLLAEQRMTLVHLMESVGILQTDAINALREAMITTIQAIPQFAPPVNERADMVNVEELAKVLATAPGTPWHQVPEYDAGGEQLDPTDYELPDPLDFREFASMINPDDPNATGIAGFQWNNTNGQ